ncbi:hypothetical protein EAH69_11800 [Faecalibacter macacae]|uniref:Uncharacterized protein n=2 Tax=Faecalibacter macacae TaxID=1859289 RepID=A0A3L9M2J3_9FLAO|nr:hypothetical protein EAH69_11800 [Faecalibacter macacae]
MLRTVFRAVLLKSADSRMVGSLTRDMVKVIKTDTVSERGQCNVNNGDLSLLKGFDFNINGKLSTTLYAPYTTSLDRVDGEVVVDIPAFVPINMINAPSGTTHFKLKGEATVWLRYSKFLYHFFLDKKVINTSTGSAQAIKASILDGQSSFRYSKMFKSLPLVGKHFYVTLNGLTLVCELLCRFYF